MTIQTQTPPTGINPHLHHLPTFAMTAPNQVDPLAERVSAINIAGGARRASPGPLSPGAATGSHSPAPVRDNGTNTGSLNGRKASMRAEHPGSPAGALSMERRSSQGGTPVPFDMQRRTSIGGTGRNSRRGSGVLMTPSGPGSVYHTRTDVSRIRIAAIV